MIKTYGERYPEMRKEDYEELLYQLKCDEIETKADCIRHIEESVIELTDRDAIPIKWLRAYCLYAKANESEVVKRVMQEWSRACDLDEAMNDGE